MDQLETRVRKIMIATNRIDGLYYLWAKSTGLNENTLALLYALNDGEEHTQKQISQEWLIPKTTVNTVVRECVEKGYVELKPGEHTKEKTIRFTEAGRTYAQQLLAHLSRVERTALERTLGQFSSEFVDGLAEFARQMEIAFEQV